MVAITKVNVKESKITNVPPTYYNGSARTAQAWLDTKRDDDNVEDGLWRIRDTLYDLTDFILKHPGGPDWLEMTKGQDITEAFITHHVSLDKIQPILAKYRVRDTMRPRNVKLTFDEDGFYMTLKKRVAAKLPELKKHTAIYSNFYVDGLFVLTLLTAVVAQRFQSTWLGILCSVFFTWCGICGHNYLHQKDNYRMYYMNLICMSYRDWRVNHVLSHHSYPNSLLDAELLDNEPFLVFVPDKNVKSFTQRYLSYIYSPLYYCIYFPYVFLYKLYTVITYGAKMYIDEFFPFVVLIAMWLFGGDHSFTMALNLFGIILVSAGLFYGIVAVHVGHHHPNTLHDGDAIRASYDWGLYTIDTIMDRMALRGNTFLALANFGDHVLHHLFPTFDHGILPQLYDILFETLAEFEAESEGYPWYEVIKGQFMQLARVETNPMDSHERYLLKLAKQKQQ